LSKDVILFACRRSGMRKRTKKNRSDISNQQIADSIGQEIKTTFQVFREKEESNEKDQFVGLVVSDPFLSVRGYTRFVGRWPETDMLSAAQLFGEVKLFVAYAHRGPCKSAAS
jgi:hypothetical protein